MRIAYCVSGHVRQFRNSLSDPNKLFKDNNIDFFLSTWDRSGADCVFWNGDKEQGDIVHEDQIKSLYSPIAMDIENRSNYEYLSCYDRPLINSPHNVNTLNTLLMFKKIKKSISYVDSSYNVVVRGRFDLLSLTINLDKNIDKNTIYGKTSPINGYPSDVFFYGDHETMIKCVPEEDFYTDEVLSSAKNAEDIFSKYLTKYNINFVVDSDLQYNLKGVLY